MDIIGIYLGGVGCIRIIGEQNNIDKPSLNGDQSFESIYGLLIIWCL